jgi:hypothetical protein
MPREKASGARSRVRTKASSRPSFVEMIRTISLIGRTVRPVDQPASWHGNTSPCPHSRACGAPDPSGLAGDGELPAWPRGYRVVQEPGQMMLHPAASAIQTNSYAISLTTQTPDPCPSIQSPSPILDHARGRLPAVDAATPRLFSPLARGRLPTVDAATPPVLLRPCGRGPPSATRWAEGDRGASGARRPEGRGLSYPRGICPCEISGSPPWTVPPGCGGEAGRNRGASGKSSMLPGAGDRSRERERWGPSLEAAGRRVVLAQKVDWTLTSYF